MSTARPPNVESAFAPSKRGAGLEGLLPRRRETEHPAAPGVEDAPQEATEEAPAARTSAPRTGSIPKRAVAPVADVEDDEIHNVAIHLPPATLEAARTETRSSEETHADLLARAFQNVDPDALRARFQLKPSTGAGGMPGRARRPKGAPGIQRQLRLSTAQRTWLDEQVASYNAPTRSALVAAVYGMYFDTITETGA